VLVERIAVLFVRCDGNRDPGSRNGPSGGSPVSTKITIDGARIGLAQESRNKNR
jgi:hypothetical protein